MSTRRNVLTMLGLAPVATVATALPVDATWHSELSLESRREVLIKNTEFWIGMIDDNHLELHDMLRAILKQDMQGFREVLQATKEPRP